MKQNLKKSTYWLSITIIGIVLGFSLQFVRAWVAPTSAPPTQNVGAPINTGDNSQIKYGNLALNQDGNYANGLLVVNGNVGIGTTTPSSGTGGQLKLDVHGNVGAEMYCDEEGNECVNAASLGSFGGMYQQFLCDGSCRIVNPFTGDCSCPSGYTKKQIDDSNIPAGAPCGSQSFYDGKGMRQFFCYKL